MSRREREQARKERREEEDRQYWLDREEEIARQDSCAHYQCTVTRFNWSGKPVQVTCEECGAVNYIEENDQ